MHFFMSNRPETLKELCLHATVEAEYGDTCVEGTHVTLAHHGPRSANPAPCVTEVPDFVRAKVQTVGVSHIDLDTLGGCMVLMGHPGAFPRNTLFWELAAFVDTRGIHRLHEVAEGFGGLAERVNARAVRKLYAWLMWVDTQPRPYPPRDGSVLEVTDYVTTAIDVLARILQGDDALLAAGDQYEREQVKLEQRSFLETFYTLEGDRPLCHVRKADGFVNHLYTHNGVVAPVVVALKNPDHGLHAVTVSTESTSVPLSCVDVVQSLWGQEAGGHRGVAGSPRNRHMTEADLYEAVQEVVSRLTSSV